MNKTEIETIDGYWKTQLNSMEAEYNKLRERFVNDTQRYYRQSIYSNYITEDELTDQIKELKRLKYMIQEVSKAHYPDTNGCLYK